MTRTMQPKSWPFIASSLFFGMLVSCLFAPQSAEQKQRPLTIRPRFNRVHFLSMAPKVAPLTASPKLNAFHPTTGTFSYEGRTATASVVDQSVDPLIDLDHLSIEPMVGPTAPAFATDVPGSAPIESPIPLPSPQRIVRQTVDRPESGSASVASEPHGKLADVATPRRSPMTANAASTWLNPMALIQQLPEIGIGESTPGTFSNEGRAATASVVDPSVDPLIDLEHLSIEPMVGPTAPSFAIDVQESTLIDSSIPLPSPQRVTRQAIDRPESSVASVASEPHGKLVDVATPRTSPITANAASTWLNPMALIQQLHEIGGLDQLEDWRDRTIDELAQLKGVDAVETGTRLEHLQELLNEGEKIKEALPRSRYRKQLARVNYMLVRQLAIWNPVYQIKSSTLPVATIRTDTVGRISKNLKQVTRLLGNSSAGLQWNEFLRVAAARRAFAQDSESSHALRKTLAVSILRRLESPFFDQQQAQFVARREFQDLQTSLRYVISEPVDYSQLLATIAEFELHPRTELAREIAEYRHQLFVSPVAEVRQLAKNIDLHYRNANARFAISSDFLNRIVPAQPDVQNKVNDVILGTRVRGRALSSSQLQIALIPDAYQWRIGFKANGDVSSRTTARNGPATFLNRGTTQFHVEKLLLVNRRGVRSWNSVGEAKAQSKLVDLSTDYDGIPLLENIARNIASQEYKENSHRSRRIIEHRVANEAMARLDKAVEETLSDWETEFNQRGLEPMKRLKLAPIAIGMSTSQERITARYRIAGHNQLAAFTPRPQAPGGNLLSVQLNESAINNTLDQLNLHGREIGLRELITEIAGKFNRSDVRIPEDIPTDVTVRFANENPAHVAFSEGLIKIGLNLAEFRTRTKKWRNLSIQTTYRPDPSSVDGRFVRTEDDIISIAGKRLRLGDRIALSGVFSKVFSKARPIPILDARLLENPKLSNARLSQFIVRDRWIGIALSLPVSSTSRLARQPQALGESPVTK